MADIDYDTVAGTKLYISTAAPAAQTVAAFEALTWVEVGKLTSIGSVEGREYATSSVSIVSNAQDLERKGTYKYPAAEFECLWDRNDAGQILVKAASKDYSTPSFKMVGQDADDDISYFRAQVSKYLRGGGGPNDPVKGTIGLLRQTDTITE